MQNNRQKPTLKSEKVLLVSKPDKKRVVEKNQKKNKKILKQKCTMNKNDELPLYILAYTYIHLYI